MSDDNGIDKTDIDIPSNGQMKYSLGLHAIIAPSYTHITTSQAEINFVPNTGGSRAAALPDMGSIDTCTGLQIDDQATRRHYAGLAHGNEFKFNSSETPLPGM